MRASPKHRKKSIVDALKSPFRGFVFINVAWFGLYLPASPFIQLFFSFGAYFLLSIVVSFVYFLFVLWRQNKMTTCDEE
jgi:hypothetical protein